MPIKTINQTAPGADYSSIQAFLTAADFTIDGKWIGLITDTGQVVYDESNANTTELTAAVANSDRTKFRLEAAEGSDPLIRANWILGSTVAITIGVDPTITDDIGSVVTSFGTFTRKINPYSSKLRLEPAGTQLRLMFAGRAPTGSPVDKTTFFNCFIDGLGINIFQANGTQQIFFHHCEITNFSSFVFIGSGTNLAAYNCVFRDGANLINTSPSGNSLFFCSIENVSSFVSTGGQNIKDCVVSLDGSSSRVFSTTAGGSLSERFANSCVLLTNGARMGGPTDAHNLSDFIAAQGSQTGAIQADPVFVDAALNNFRLQDSSPCIERAASDQFSPTVSWRQIDFDGNLRDSNTPDMGAFESAFRTLAPAPVNEYPSDQQLLIDSTPFLAWKSPVETREGGTLQFRVTLSKSNLFDTDINIFDSWSSGENFGASIVSGNAETFDMSGDPTLIVSVDGTPTTINFVSLTDFVDATIATAAEISLVIDTALTTGNSKAVTIFDSGLQILQEHVQISSNDVTAGTIQITGGTANTVLGFGSLLKAAPVDGGVDPDLDIQTFHVSTDYIPGNDPEGLDSLEGIPIPPDATWLDIGTGRPSSLGIPGTDGVDATISSQHVRVLLPQLETNVSWFFRVTTWGGELV